MPPDDLAPQDGLDSPGPPSRSLARDSFFYDLLRSQPMPGSRRMTLTGNDSAASSASSTAAAATAAGQPLPLGPALPHRESLSPHLASPESASTDAPTLVTLSAWCEAWWQRGAHGPLNDLFEVMAGVVKCASALHARHLALVVARPEYFCVHVPGDNSPPVVQLRSFAGVVELPAWDKGRATGELYGSSYLEHRMLDPLNLPFMARELFNAKDGWEGEPAAVFSCGILFQTLLAKDSKPPPQPPKDDFGLVEAIYRHLRRGSERASEIERARKIEAATPIFRLLHRIVGICAAPESASRYSFRGLLFDLRQVSQAAQGVIRIEDVDIGRVNQVSRYQDSDVLLDRTRQLAVLDDILAEVEDSRQLRIGHVFGASGSGKSRLVERWTNRVREANPDVFVVSAKLDPNVSTPLPSVTLIFEALLDLVSAGRVESDWPMKADVQALLNGQPKLAALLSEEWQQRILVRTPDGRTDEAWSLHFDAMMAACKRLLQLLTDQAALTVLVIDDAQWLGRDELQLWRALFNDGVRPKNLLVISNHRSMTPPPPTACLSNDSRLIAEALPLSLASISAFLMETFKWDELPSVLAGFIFRETGGNAFYVRRLLKLLVEKAFNFDYAALQWDVDLGALPTYAADGIDQFVSRALEQVTPDALRVLQSLSFLPTRDIDVSLLAELHQSLNLPPLLSELTQQGILLAPSASSVRWVHDKFKEATRTTIAAGDARRKKHEEMASFLEKRPGFLFDAADNHLEALEGIPVPLSPHLTILLCKAAQASLRTSIESADRYLSAAEKLFDFRAASSWSQLPETCFSHILAKAEISTKLQRVTPILVEEIAGALPRCQNLLQKLIIWTVLVRMTSKHMPETATRFAHEAVSAAGYSFDAHHEIATTPDAVARLERHLMDPVASISSEDRIAICLIDLIAHFAYTSFMTLSFQKQLEVTSLGVALVARSAATMQNGSSAYICAWRGHQLSTMLQLEKASIFNSLGSRLLEKLPGSLFESDTCLTLSLQLHLKRPLREISLGQDWLIAIRSGNWLMANFMLTLGLTTAIMAGRLARNPLEGHLLADYPGWQEWLPLLGEQCSAFMGAVRQVIDHLVDPSGADAASDPLTDRLQSAKLFEPSNPVLSLASATVQMLVALLLEAPAAIYPPILSRGEGLYFAGTGMALHYEWAFLRSFYRIEHGSEQDLLLIPLDLEELSHLTATPDWPCRIALLQTLMRLRTASEQGLSSLLDCAGLVERTSAILVEASYDQWSNALLSRFAKRLKAASGGMLAVGFAAAAFASASNVGALGLAKIYGAGFEGPLSSLTSTLRPAPPKMTPRSQSESASAPIPPPVVASAVDDVPQLDDRLDSRLKLSTVLRSLVLIAGEPDPNVLVVRLMKILLQFTRADFGALALRDASSGELLLRSSGTMRAIATSRASLSSRQQRTPLQDAFFKNLSPSSYVGLPLQNGKGVLFLSSGSDVLLDLASSEDSQSIEVVIALTGIAQISIDSSVARRNLSTTVAERTAALKQALEAERSFLSVVSHELRTPLFSILGLVTVLETSDNLSALEVGQLAQVKSSGEDLARLINQVLDFSRLQSGVQALEQIDFNLRDVVEHALDAVAAKGQQKGLELVCDCSVTEDLPTLHGDSFKIKQIVLNYLSNAVKFTETGFVKVRWEQSVDAANEAIVVVYVEDSGTGVSEEQQKRLFQSFSQADASILRSHGGFGLGLSISRSLARALGGDAWVRSEYGVGSTFGFSFKAAFSDDRSAADTFKPSVDSSPRRALVYCPPPTLRDSLVRNLKAFGFAVDTTSADAGNFLKDELDVLSKDDPDKPGQPVKYDVVLITPEMVNVEDIPVIRKRQPGAKIRILPRTIDASTEASRLEISHNAILARPLKASALYAACQSELSSAARKRAGMRTPGQARVGSISKDFAKRNPIASILFVDDNKINISVGLKICAALGYLNVDTASDGKQAVDAAANKPYELILMDLNMPVLDGFSAAKAILASESTKDHPMIVALTANSSEYHREQSAASGFVAFLSKPLNMTEFKAVLADVSRKKRARIEAPDDSDDGAEAVMKGEKDD